MNQASFRGIPLRAISYRVTIEMSYYNVTKSDIAIVILSYWALSTGIQTPCQS
jgi:hypothetical protein